MYDFSDLDYKSHYDLLVAFREKWKDNPGIISEQEFLESDLYKKTRHRAMSDLYFLAKYFIGWDLQENKLMQLDTHLRVCDLFVKKDNTKEIGEQDWRKERLLLYPRGSLKSSTDVIDAVQWILNFPNIRILFLTATEDLAVGFMDILKSHFIFKVPVPSFMNLFFPEFCVHDTKEELSNMYEFTTPQRTITSFAEPTVMASSIRSTMSGKHFEVIKADDIVSTPNSENEDQCQKVIKHFSIDKKMLMAFGYLDFIGTRYHEEDIYGHLIETNVGNLKVEKGPCWELTENTDTGRIILIGRSIQPKTGFEDKKIFEELKQEECDLLFPHYHTYKFLHKEFLDGEVAFEGQMQQNPRPKSHITFDRPLLLRHTIPFQGLPFRGPITITWDFAFSTKKGRDYCTAAVGLWNDKSQLFIIDLVRARFKYYELAKKVVELAAQYRPQVIGIENAAGSKMLEGSILIEAAKTQIPEVQSVCSRIDWFDPDQQKDAKRTRMGALHPWLMNDQLFFVSHLPHLEVLYKEFELCLTTHHHDDIPDVISQQPRYAPRMALMISKKEFDTSSIEQAQYNLLYEDNCDAFGRIGMGQRIPVDPAPVVFIDPGVEAETPTRDLPSILGAGLCG